MRVGLCSVADSCLEVLYQGRVACAALFVCLCHEARPTTRGLRRWTRTRTACDRTRRREETLWCLARACTNYYRYLERPLARKCGSACVIDTWDDDVKAQAQVDTQLENTGQFW